MGLADRRIILHDLKFDEQFTCRLFRAGSVHTTANNCIFEGRIQRRTHPDYDHVQREWRGHLLTIQKKTARQCTPPRYQITATPTA